MKASLVVTTIQAPNAVMQSLAMAAKENGCAFFVIGDRKTPDGFELEGATYFSVSDQAKVFGSFGEALPLNHYSRKNLGYLAALDVKSEWIVETDDDNYPLEDFFTIPSAVLESRKPVAGGRWVNVYDYFCPTEPIWPRGFPLELVNSESALAGEWVTSTAETFIVQGLADENPDVDAVYRLTRPLPVSFSRQAEPVELAEGSWCPFNSQNTWIRRDVIVLAYLPSYCSFRMTDIWRSFVAQRCLWARGGTVHFVAPTVRQERNDHNLLKDFEDEVSGYLNNDRITSALQDTELSGDLSSDIVSCYQTLVEIGVIPSKELELLSMWVREVGLRAGG